MIAGSSGIQNPCFRFPPMDSSAREFRLTYCAEKSTLSISAREETNGQDSFNDDAAGSRSAGF